MLKSWHQLGDMMCESNTWYRIGNTGVCGFLIPFLKMSPLSIFNYYMHFEVLFVKARNFHFVFNFEFVVVHHVESCWNKPFRPIRPKRY